MKAVRPREVHETLGGLQETFFRPFGPQFGLKIIVQSFYGKKSVNLPLIATEGFSTVLDSAMYPY